jgi:hypothetical protein
VNEAWFEAPEETSFACRLQEEMGLMDPLYTCSHMHDDECAKPPSEMLPRQMAASEGSLVQSYWSSGPGWPSWYWDDAAHSQPSKTVSRPVNRTTLVLTVLAHSRRTLLGKAQKTGIKVEEPLKTIRPKSLPESPTLLFNNRTPFLFWTKSSLGPQVNAVAKKAGCQLLLSAPDTLTG